VGRILRKFTPKTHVRTIAGRAKDAAGPRMRAWYQGQVGGFASGKRRQAVTTAKRATNSTPARVLARSGLSASGVVHVLIGVIAIKVANGLRGRADQSGALDAVSDVPGGTIVLWVAFVSLLGLAVWQWTGPMSARREGVLPNTVRDRFKAVSYLVVGLAALVFAVGGHGNTARAAHTVSSALIDLPGGVFVLLAVGAGVASVGASFVYRGVSRKFREDITPPAGPIAIVVTALGVAGYTAKGLALVIVGALFVGGALVGDSSWTTGLDGAVRYLTTLPTGVWPLLVVAGGLIAHGVYLGSRAVFLRR
jgi:hypothetical protein